VRDGIEFERRGKPTVVLAHDRFIKAARAQAANLQMPDLNIAVIEQGRPWHTDEMHKAEVEKIIPQVAQGLAKNV
jgi:hypothetical protein